MWFPARSAHGHSGGLFTADVMSCQKRPARLDTPVINYSVLSGICYIGPDVSSVLCMYGVPQGYLLGALGAAELTLGSFENKAPVRLTLCGYRPRSRVAGREKKQDGVSNIHSFYFSGQVSVVIPLGNASICPSRSKFALVPLKTDHVYLPVDCKTGKKSASGPWDLRTYGQRDETRPSGNKEDFGDKREGWAPELNQCRVELERFLLTQDGLHCTYMA